MNRRDLVATAAAAAAALAGRGASLAATLVRPGARRAPVPGWPTRLGLQLYTVRDRMARDVAATLRAVADVGYEEVEFAGYFDREPVEIRHLLDATGLESPSSHVPLDALRADLDSVAAAARAIGHRFLVVPSLPSSEGRSLADYRRLGGEMNAIGARCRDAGLQLGYHNHAFEFERRDGAVPYDVLLQSTDPELVAMEIDLYWVVAGGGDPLDYIERFPGRFRLCHVKDRRAGGDMAEVGAGTIDFGAIFARSEQAGLQHFFVEHDNPRDSLASIAASHDYLAARAAGGGQ